MDILEQALKHKRTALEERLELIGDPIIKQLLADISTIQRTKEILKDAKLDGVTSDTPITAPTVVPNSNGNITQGDAVYEILKKRGQAMHVSDIFREVQKYGITTTKTSLSSIVAKDRRKRFVNTGNNTFKINPKFNGTGDANAVSRLPPDFSLIGSIKELLTTFEGEFSQPIVYQKLVEKFPNVASSIQRPSVSTTLRKLVEDGLIEVTFEGFGSDPKRYRRTETKN